MYRGDARREDRGDRGARAERSRAGRDGARFADRAIDALLSMALDKAQPTAISAQTIAICARIYS